MRDTSQEAWERINASGILGKHRTLAYNTLFRHGPMTGAELSQVVKHPGLWKRLSELEAVGVIRDTEQRRHCRVTGYMATLWDVTSTIPTVGYKAPPRRPKRFGGSRHKHNTKTCPDCQHIAAEATRRTEQRLSRQGLLL